MNIGIIMFWVILAIVYLNNFRVIFKSLRCGEVFGVLFEILTLPFLVFVTFSMLLGGSAFNDAATQYELYEVGHYYLANHGSYTEVTREQFLFIRSLEIVGIATFAIAFILGIIYNIKNRR